MKRKGLYLALYGIMSLAMITGCKGEESHKTVEKDTSKQTEAQDNSESKDDDKESVKENIVVIQDKDIYDGINRIAISICGNPETQIGLSWYTPNTGDITYGNDVELFKASTMELVDIDYEVDTGEAEYDEDSMYHQTVLSGLESGTEYRFRIGDKASNQWSDYGSFKTASENMSEFSFIAVTDTQSEHLADAYFSTATFKKALEVVEDSAFIMHSGDFVEDGDEEELWIAQMNTAQDILMNNIIAPAVGNHEEDEHSWWQHFKIPHTNDHKTTGAYYSYDYGNVHFVVLDTNKDNEEGTSYVDDEQLQWLKDDLKAAKDNGSWIIVNMHKGLYTVGEHSDDDKFMGDEGARKRVGQVFEEYGVDLVIQGHDHCPSVTKPIKDGKVSDDGIIYINTGAAGAKTYELDTDLMSKEYYDLFDYMDKGEREDDTYQNFAIVDVSEEKLSVKMYELNMLKNMDNLYIIYELEIIR